ncbi:MFS general substrate transporter [Fragilariopsis cylindrus CCMP1102]|uniref:MFS general substrate transporter n=1 Tax=Fragilariopsis cylindrus CCMP1102 TaxID=635003 RepID=A0A1E7F3M5_9STRA|nr:MFS general substrate transporter [Fragilariopsis cylindrus CCMP1102]|eukprot:OEU12798.1 MFS general substrate transporter [Fragilariopsis cylindrus CCMP1102]
MSGYHQKPQIRRKEQGMMMTTRVIVERRRASAAVSTITTTPTMMTMMMILAVGVVVVTTAALVAHPTNAFAAHQNYYPPNQNHHRRIMLAKHSSIILNLNLYKLRGGSSSSSNNSKSSASVLMTTGTSNILGGGGGGGGNPNGDDALIVSTSKEDTPVVDDKDTPEEIYRKRGMTIALLLSNFSVMGAKCALPSVLSLLLSSDRGLSFITTTATSTAISNSSPQNQFSKLLGLSTLAIAIGKLVLGPVIDKLGGIKSLQITLGLLILLLSIITCCQQFLIFAIAWIGIDFIFSSCWASCISSIQQSFSNAEEWGTQVGYLATGARLGNTISFSIFGSLLYLLETNQYLKNSIQQPWRIIFGVSTLLQLIPLCLLYHFGKLTISKNQEQKQQQSVGTAADTTTAATTATANPTSSSSSSSNSSSSSLSSISILKKEMKTIEFWLHLISRSCLMVFASFLLFVPTLMNQLYDCSSAISAQVASIYSFGCLLAVSFATLASYVQLANAIGILSLTKVMSTISLFLWGFAFSLPFYLPSSLYALERGGRNGSATISDCFDFFGFGALAFFNKYVTSIQQHSVPSSWIGCFTITTSCSIIAMITQSLAVYFVEKKKKKKKENSSIKTTTSAKPVVA